MTSTDVWPISYLRVPDEEEWWADADILHITEIAAMFSDTGRLANALGLVANPEYGDMGRHLRRQS